MCVSSSTTYCYCYCYYCSLFFNLAVSLYFFNIHTPLHCIHGFLRALSIHLYKYTYGSVSVFVCVCLYTYVCVSISVCVNNQKENNEISLPRNCHPGSRTFLFQSKKGDFGSSLEVQPSPAQLPTPGSCTARRLRHGCLGVIQHFVGFHLQRFQEFHE